MTMRNRLLIYVYNLFGERETILPGKRPERAPKERAHRRNHAEGRPPGAEPAAGNAAALVISTFRGCHCRGRTGRMNA